MMARSLMQALALAVMEMRSRRHECLTVEHLLLAMTREQLGRVILKGCGVDIPTLRHQLEETRVGGPQTLVTPINDAERCLKWQRIAPPFAIDSSDFEISDIIVTDKWEYPISEAEQWPYLGGKKLESGAFEAVTHGRDVVA